MTEKYRIIFLQVFCLKSCSKNTFKITKPEVATVDVLQKKLFLKVLQIFTEKRLCWSLFLIKLQGCNFINQKLHQKCFPVKFTKFLRTPILKIICERVLLGNTHNITLSHAIPQKCFQKNKLKPLNYSGIFKGSISNLVSLRFLKIRLIQKIFKYIQMHFQLGKKKCMSAFTRPSLLKITDPKLFFARICKKKSKTFFKTFTFLQIKQPLVFVC